MEANINFTKAHTGKWESRQDLGMYSLLIFYIYYEMHVPDQFLSSSLLKIKP